MLLPQSARLGHIYYFIISSAYDKVKRLLHGNQFSVILRISSRQSRHKSREGSWETSAFSEVFSSLALLRFSRSKSAPTRDLCLFCLAKPKYLKFDFRGYYWGRKSVAGNHIFISNSEILDALAAFFSHLLKISKFVSWQMRCTICCGIYFLPV